VKIGSKIDPPVNTFFILISYLTTIYSDTIQIVFNFHGKCLIVSASSNRALSLHRSVIASTLALCLAGSAFAQARPVSPYVLDRLQDAPTAERGLFLDPLLLDVIGPNGQDELFALTGEDGGVEFASEEREIRLDFAGRLACFDIAPVAASKTRIVGLDQNGYPSVDLFNASQFGFSPDLRVVELQSSNSTACFWDVAEDIESDRPFTLFGDPVLDEGGLFSDSFERRSQEISVRYLNVPEQVGLNELFTYEIRIENTGNAAISNAGINELFVGNPGLANAVLATTEGSLECTPSAGATCGNVISEIEIVPGQFFQLPYFRSDFGDGTSLAPGSNITLSVERRVVVGTDEGGQPLSPLLAIGNTIDLTAVALSVDGSEDPVPWSSDRANMLVVANGFLGGSAPGREVTVSDSLDEQITVQTFQPNEDPLEIAGLTINGQAEHESAVMSPQTQQTNADGLATFDIGSQAAGSIRFSFEAAELISGAEPAATFFDVTFVADDASALRFEALLDPSYDVGSSIPGPQVCAIDQFGNVATDQDGQNVVLSLYQNEKPVRVGIETNELIGGCTIFSDISLDQDVAGAGYQLFAQRGFNVTGTSSTFSINDPQ